MATKHHIEYGIRYIKENYEQISIRLKKGERDRYKQAAEALGLSVNQLFITAVEEFIAEHLADYTQRTAEQEPTPPAD